MSSNAPGYEQRAEIEQNEAARAAREQTEAERIEAERAAKLEHQKKVNAKKWNDFLTAFDTLVTEDKIAELEGLGKDVPNQPDPKIYRAGVAVVERSMPYKVKDYGLGINLFTQHPNKDVLVIPTTLTVDARS